MKYRRTSQPSPMVRNAIDVPIKQMSKEEADQTVQSIIEGRPDEARREVERKAA